MFVRVCNGIRSSGRDSWRHDGRDDDARWLVKVSRRTGENRALCEARLVLAFVCGHVRSMCWEAGMTGRRGCRIVGAFVNEAEADGLPGAAAFGCWVWHSGKMKLVMQSFHGEVGGGGSPGSLPMWNAQVTWAHTCKIQIVVKIAKSSCSFKVSRKEQTEGRAKIWCRGCQFQFKVVSAQRSLFRALGPVTTVFSDGGHHLQSGRPPCQVPQLP